jgi:ketosteroid isomerase-like protein
MSRAESGPPLFPARIETGREQMRERFAASTQSRRYLCAEPVLLHETADPEVIVVEATLQGEHVAGGKPFALSYVMVVTFATVRSSTRATTRTRSRRQTPSDD